jgi:glutamate/tyrosine decarboxylase-like PLP-dependent enzyme
LERIVKAVTDNFDARKIDWAEADAVRYFSSSHTLVDFVCTMFSKIFFQDFITEDITSSERFIATQNSMKSILDEISNDIRASSLPFWSVRYQAHMVGDPTIPALVGYFTAMLYNQNNATIEAAPWTVLIELVVGKQLSAMIGYNIDEKKKGPLGWGHVTCGGTVANLESMW